MTPPMTPHLSALGFTLIHVCWQAAVIAGLYKLIDISLPRLRSPGRYVLGLAALLLILVCAIGTFIYEDIRLAGAPALAALGTVTAEGTAQQVRNMTLEGLLPWLDGAWLLGVAALSVRMAGGLWFIQRLSAAAEAVPDAVARRFDVLMQRAGLSNVRIRLHRHIDGPFVIGALRSVVYLPMSALTSLSPDQLDAVLAHELEHVRRADYLWNLVQSLIETLFFFHPAVWWLGAQLREQRELCCDDAAVSLCRDPLTYATALLSLEEQRREPRLAMALNGHGAGRTLVSRVARVLGDGQKTSKGRPTAAYALPIILLVVAAFAAPGARVAAQDKPQDTKMAVAEAASDETAAGLMDDETASSVSSRANTPDMRVVAARTRHDVAMAMTDTGTVWSGDDKASWKHEKQAWKQEAKAWQGQADDWKDAAAAWTPELAQQVADEVRKAGYLSDDDRRQIELETRKARDEADVQLRDNQTDLEEARRVMSRLRVPAPPTVPEAPEAPADTAVPDAPAPDPAPALSPVQAPAVAAPPAAPHPVLAIPAPAPVARIAADYRVRSEAYVKAAVAADYRITSKIYTETRVAPMKTIKVTLAPMVHVVIVPPKAVSEG